MSAPQGELDLEVVTVRAAAADVVELELADRSGGALPA